MIGLTKCGLTQLYFECNSSSQKEGLVPYQMRNRYTRIRQRVRQLCMNSINASTSRTFKRSKSGTIAVEDLSDIAVLQ